MRETMLKIRWRLLLGAISLVLVVAGTLPAAASRVNLLQRVADIWPNSEIADIWPNAQVNDAWPNAQAASVLANTPDNAQTTPPTAAAQAATQGN